MPPGKYIRTPEICKRNSESMIGNTPYNKGKKGLCSPETIAKMKVNRNDGRITGTYMRTPEIIQKNKDSVKDRYYDSEETRKKKSICKIGNKNPMKNIDVANKSHTTLRKRFAEGNLKYTDETRQKYRKKRSTWTVPTRDTSIEIKLQGFLTELGIEFIKHKLMAIPHYYQCDIFVPSMNLVIEADGNFWHHYSEGTNIDHIRTKELIEAGFKVLRLWESEIKELDVENFKRVLLAV